MSIEDLTIKEMRDAVTVLMSIAESGVQHTLEYIKDAEHTCASATDMLHGLEAGTIPELDDWDVQVILGFEDAMLAQFRFLRQVMIEQGLTVAKEVGS